MTTTFLIRHAKPSAGWGGHDDDPGLDEVGWSQAKAAADALSALPEDHRPRAVVSSPLRRCRETAQPTAEALGLSIEIDPRVGEIPTPAGLAPDARGAWLRAAFTGAWSDIVGDLDYEAWRRGVAAAVAAHPGAVIFSHFVAINGLVSLLANEEAVVVFRPDHVSMTTVDVSPAGVTLIERGREAETGVL